MSPFLLLAEALGVLTYSACCVALGWVLGIKYQHRKLTREVAVEMRWMKRGLVQVKVWLDSWGMFVVGLLVLVCAGLTLLSSHESGHASNVSDRALSEVQAQATCLTTYANQLYDSLTPRQKASEALQKADKDFNDALVNMLSDALSVSPDQDRVHADALALRDAAQHKQRVAGHLSAERAQNPYPAPPKEVCPK